MSITSYNNIKRERQRGEGEGQYLRHLPYYPEVEEGGGLRGENEITNNPDQRYKRKHLFSQSRSSVRPKIIMTRWIPHICKRDARHTVAVEVASIRKHLNPRREEKAASYLGG